MEEKHKKKISKIITIALVIFAVIALIVFFIYKKNNSNSLITGNANNESINTIITENNSDENINVEGITEEEKNEYTEILSNLEISSQQPWTGIITIDNKYIDVVTNSIIQESSSEVDENGYITSLTYSDLSLIRYEEDSVSKYAEYTYDSQNRPTEIKYHSVTMIDKNKIDETNQINISYYDNGKIKTLKEQPKGEGTPNGLEGLFYTFYYKENGDIDSINSTMDFAETNIIPYKTENIEFIYGNNGIVTAKGNNLYVKFKKEDLIDMNNLPLYFNTYLFGVYTEKKQVINNSNISAKGIYIPIAYKQSIETNFSSKIKNIYNENGYIDISYNIDDKNIKTKYDYIEKNNKLMQIETDYNNEGKKQNCIIYSFNNYGDIDQILYLDNIDKLKQMTSSTNSNSLNLIVYAEDSKMTQNELVELCSNYGTVITKDVYQNPDITLNYCIIQIDENNFDKAFDELSGNPNIYNVEQQ